MGAGEETGADVATVAATVGAGVTGNVGTEADGAGVSKEVGGNVAAGITNVISAVSSHVDPIWGMVAVIVALALYSDSKHLFANSFIAP